LVQSASYGRCRRYESFFSVIEQELCDAIRIYVRYDQEDEKGETRRERNTKYDTPSPEIELPDDGIYIWDWYHEISNGLRRVHDGICIAIPWSEFIAWSKVTSVEVLAAEYKVLRAIDNAFVEAMNDELQAYHDRENERRKQEMG
jgi:hypothetical protein